MACGDGGERRKVEDKDGIGTGSHDAEVSFRYNVYVKTNNFLVEVLSRCIARKLLKSGVFLDK